jgi:HK97 family phage prohead protease
MHITKALPLKLKNLDATGTFEGYASTYVPDQVSDVIMPGAFTHSLKQWRQKNAWPPLLWQHQAEAVIGTFETVREDTKGLFVKGVIVRAAEKAEGAYALLKAGALQGLSIGFTLVVARRDPVTKHRKIFQLNLEEISLVTFPANREARIESVKSALGP